MATHHAAPGEVVNLASWAGDLPAEHSKVIARCDEMELARLVLAAGEVVGNQHIAGPLVLHCLIGSVDISAHGLTRHLAGGELLYLSPGEKFTMVAVQDSLVLLTFIFVAKAP
jgi:quercetin dioxygenase-like cupin family protein